jgi:hypothetical protein
MYAPKDYACGLVAYRRLVFLFILSGHSVWAAEPVVVRPVAQRIADADFACVQKDWSRAAVNVKADLHFTKDFFDGAVRTIVVAGALQVIRAPSRSVSRLDPASQKVKLQIDDLVSVLKDKADQLPDDPRKGFLVACMAKGLSAKLLQYIPLTQRFMIGACTTDIVKNGGGECTEFAAVGDDFAGKLGLRAIYSGGVLRDKDGKSLGGHEIFSVNINGKWYFAEPQDSECNFQPHHPDEGGLRSWRSHCA